jgi:glucuronate isomerase
MKRFMDKDFLLDTPLARTLYHRHASKLPIYDYHCHLPAQQIAANEPFENITRIWLNGDHYKWRAMRANGVPEKFCTGNASDWEKFQAWAATVPYTIKNPLFHWTHLELKAYFGITGITLGPATAKKIYAECNRVIKKQSMSPFKIFRNMNVSVVCTTDDPADTLEHHLALQKQGTCPAKVYPTFRPDKAMAIDNPVAFKEWLKKLETVTSLRIRKYEDFITALSARHAFFHQAGCRISDHALETAIYEDASPAEAAAIFADVLTGNTPNTLQVRKFKTALMLHFGEWNARRNWAMQMHFGAQRNNNTRMFELLGPDTGFDSMADQELARPLARFLDKLAYNNSLPRTILYNLNPKDNAVLAAMLGNFQDGTIPGKMQWGSAWWFLDTKEGMERQMTTLAQSGLLSRFMGMLTDSRSLLSYPRHEYFRRILCGLLGRDADRGEIPADLKLLGPMVANISYHNAVEYFGLKL